MNILKCFRLVQVCPILTAAFCFSFPFVAFIDDASAQSDRFEPDLAETLEWLSGGPSDVAVIPASAPARTLHPMPAIAIEAPLASVPGKPFHVLDPPPTSKAYYKVPIYLALGLPRDLIDGVFGFIGFVPLLNLPVVGVGYELIPTQALVRDPRDWHRWGGRRNKNGHGFIDSDGWGWFPTAHSVKFTVASKRKLRKYQKENEGLYLELQGLNRTFAERNKAIEDRKDSAAELARYELSAGNAKAAVERILPYRIAYPRDRRAHAILLASLSLAADRGSLGWAGPYLWQDLSAISLRDLRAAEKEIESVFERFPSALLPARALVFTKTRLGKRASAMDVARQSYDHDPLDWDRVRLVFETALSAGDVAQAQDSFLRLERIYRDRSDTPVLSEKLGLGEDGLDRFRWRLAIFEGNFPYAREGLSLRIVEDPTNPYYHYYLGCAELGALEEEENFSAVARAALGRFERAFMASPNAPLRRRSEIALNYTRALSDGRSYDSDSDSRGGFIDLSGFGR